jgi:hypothetical protein
MKADKANVIHPNSRSRSDRWERINPRVERALAAATHLAIQAFAWLPVVIAFGLPLARYLNN